MENIRNVGYAMEIENDQNEFNNKICFDQSDEIILISSTDDDSDSQHSIETLSLDDDVSEELCGVQAVQPTLPNLENVFLAYLNLIYMTHTTTADNTYNSNGSALKTHDLSHFENDCNFEPEHFGMKSNSFYLQDNINSTLSNDDYEMLLSSNSDIKNDDETLSSSDRIQTGLASGVETEECNSLQDIRTSELPQFSSERPKYWRKQKNHYNNGYECTPCNRTFKTRAGFTQHNRINHSGPRQYRCQQCGKRYQFQQQLEAHEKRHASTGKPFPCKNCPKGFWYSTDLDRHFKLHHGIAPDKCPECGKGFVRPGHLFDHMQTHAGRKARRKALLERRD